MLDNILQKCPFWQTGVNFCWTISKNVIFWQTGVTFAGQNDIFRQTDITFVGQYPTKMLLSGKQGSLLLDNILQKVYFLANRHHLCWTISYKMTFLGKQMSLMLDSILQKCYFLANRDHFGWTTSCKNLIFWQTGITFAGQYPTK